ncbi:MAG: phosphopantothenoylcysteine decarboxylase [Planctomycetales bacterium]|nr:phosphopantothenoylcysteine decarboxylase [Planctomycetales bacterium]
MARILITSGPTRQYIDPVRYLTNASSGRMGAALASAALQLGHEVLVVSGPVAINYPSSAQVVMVETTEDMLAAVMHHFPDFDGLIGAAAPCDYMPRRVSSAKIAKDGQPLQLELMETADVVATAASRKAAHQWVVGFALETEDRRFRSIVKMQRKCCDLMVSNGPEAIDSLTNEVEILAADGTTLKHVSGSKQVVAEAILQATESLIKSKLGRSNAAKPTSKAAHP